MFKTENRVILKLSFVLKANVLKINLEDVYIYNKPLQKAYKMLKFIIN